MAFLLPSYFQKRLLRYALSRLQFVETDDLDLENLGVTLGQRSVIELKDVGLKLKELSAILSLPTTIILHKARVNVLKLTIPADLYGSGIVVEVLGVDVHVKIQDDISERDAHRAHPPPAAGPARGSKANRPRIVPPSVYDPGGHDGRKNRRPDDDVPPMPNPYHLAASFLESEPREETLELQAAIASQSQHLSDSATSSTSESHDTGLGSDKGASLPTFIANFFKSVADRLQVSIKRVALTVEIQAPKEVNGYDHTAENGDPIMLLLKISEIALEGLHPHLPTKDSRVGKRLFRLHQLSVISICEAEIVPKVYQISPMPSLEVSRPNSKVSHVRDSATIAICQTPSPDRSDMISSPVSSSGKVPGPAGRDLFSSQRSTNSADGSNQSASRYSDLDSIHDPISHSLISDSAFSSSSEVPNCYRQQFSESSSSDSVPAFASMSGSTRGDFQRSRSRGVNSRTHVVMSPRPNVASSADLHEPSETIDNRIRAEMLAKTGRFDDKVQTRQSSAPSSRDLTQSRIFTHAEAESMYMSAVSNRTAVPETSDTMPGGWGSSESSSSPSTEIPEQSGQAESRGPRPSPALPPAASAGPLASITTSKSPVRSENDLSQTSDAAYERRTDLPSPQASDKTSLIAKKLLIIERVSIWVPSRFSLKEAASSATDMPVQTDDVLHSGNRSLDTSPLSPSTDYMDPPTLTPSSHTFEAEISCVHAQVDISVGKILALSTKALTSILNTGKEGAHSSLSPESSPTFSLMLQLNSIFVDFREHVPEHVESTSWSNVQDQQSSSTAQDSFRNMDMSTTASSKVLQPQMSDQTNEEMLLRFGLSGAKYTSFSSGVRSKQALKVAKMTLSHATDDVLVFRHDIEMRQSTKDISAANEDDLFCNIETTEQIDKVAVQMKPLHLTLDLLKLDDVLSRSGGLNSLLELGNSIVSTSTFRSSPRAPEIAQPRGQGVRFAPVANHDIVQQSTPTKINVRVAGIIVELVGSEATLRLRSSPVKIVHRREGLGIHIDRTTVEGPFLQKQDQIPDIEIDLRNIRMEYLTVPRETDLDRLLSILTPTKDKYDDDDDIMVDTLLRQRRQGAVLRLTVEELQSSMRGFGYVGTLAKLASELGRLSTVTKYLPVDDRPGVLTLILFRKLDLGFQLEDTIGTLRLQGEMVEAAHVNVPSLMATQTSKLSLLRNNDETLINEAAITSPDGDSPPMIMCRFIADEMEPTVKVRLSNACIEYRVPTLIAFINTKSLSASSRESKAASDEQKSRLPTSGTSSSHSEAPSELVKRARIAVDIRDCALALNPHMGESKALIVFSEASLFGSLEKEDETTAFFDIKKASILVIDKIGSSTPASDPARQQIYFDETDQIQHFVKAGFVPVGHASAASVAIKLSHARSRMEQSVDVELRNNLFILETCADSTQTLIGILNGLTPPSQPSKVTKYRTEIVPIEDMLASFSGDAFVTESGPEAGIRARSSSDPDSITSEQPDLEYVSEFYHTEDDDELDTLGGSYVDSEVSESSASVQAAPVRTRRSVAEAGEEDAMTHSLLDFREDHFARTSTVGGTAHRWDSTQNTYGLSNEKSLQGSPLRVSVRDVHIIWNLFDGYDWQSTRDTMSQAVKDIETKASCRRPRSNSKLSTGAEEEDESVIGDFLFNSIYIGIPANKDPRELANNINRNIDDLASDTGSYATSTTVTASPARPQRGSSRTRLKRLRLNRSKHHKMTFELEGLSADFLVFPPGSSEVESSVDVRVKRLEVFDHVPTSTWRKFATYMQDAGERESDTNLIHLEMLNVKPVADLDASEIILKVTVLPLRLHVDQDALDFMSRFFEFKDESAPQSSTPSTPPFLQRVEINPIRVRLDFKPKRVDYGGLRSGRTTEFMNFFILDRADMVLRRVILYGVSGLDRLGIMLNNIWTPDVKANQLPGILAGLAPIRSIVNVGSGVRDLVVVPMKEYQKDGRIVRSIQKGALAFGKTTTKELISLGAKLAIGTQTVLQNTETVLAPRASEGRWEEADFDEDSKKQISLYADQPLGIVQGLRGAYASLERDLLLARDAIVAVPGEVMASGSASGAAKAVLKQTPTIILRPAIGVSRAVGQTLLGAGNTLDRSNWRRMEEKYKRH